MLVVNWLMFLYQRTNKYGENSKNGGWNATGGKHRLRSILQNWSCHPAFTCSNLTIETLEQGVKYVQS